MLSAPISCERLSKSFGKVTALRDVSLSLPEGSVYALIGANGSGKSTLMRVALRIHRPTSGTSHILGKRSCDLRPTDFRQIGYVAEGQRSPDWLTAAQYQDFLVPYYPAWDRNRFQALRKRLRVPKDRKLEQMSRGTRMKTLLMAALAYRPRVLLLDEPLGGLDPLAREEIMAALREESAGATILISSHDLMEIESFATHIGFLEDGELRFSEPIAELLARFRRITAGAETLIEMNYHAGETERLLAERYGPNTARIEPMTLRDIFLALGRASYREEEA